MLLSELIGVKKYHSMDWNTIISKLEQETGIQMTASGRYGSVFTKPNWNYVIKIFDMDPEYLAFIDFVLTHNNKHYPKIIKTPRTMHHFHSRDSSSTDKFFIVKIEKLLPISDQLGKFIESSLENITEAVYRRYVMPKEERGYAFDGDNMDRDWMTPNGIRERTSAVKLMKQYPWIKSLGYAYWKIMEADLGAPDIHAGNFMMRQNGTIVIIDPVWSGMRFDPRSRSQQSNYDDWEGDYDSWTDHTQSTNISGPNYLKKNKS